MTPQYQDIISIIKDDSRPEDIKLVDRYFRRYCMFPAISVLLLVVYIVLFIFSLSHRDSPFWAAVLSDGIMRAFYWLVVLTFALFIPVKMIFFKKAKSFLLTDCDPDRMLSCLIAMSSRQDKVDRFIDKSFFFSIMREYFVKRRSRRFGLCFYNLCTSLYYAGRFEEARKILPLFPKYCPGDAERFKYELLCARFAYHDRNEEALHMHCYYLNGWAGRIREKDLFYEIYQETMQYPVLLRMEKDGAWQQAYGMLRQAEAASHKSGRSMLFSVKLNFMLYWMAKGMGDERCAAHHREFVLQNGGFLWYRRELTGLQEAGQTLGC